MSFHNIASVYDRFNDLSVYEHWLDFTLNSLDQPPKQALDLACGTGWFTQLLAPFVPHITGVDIDPNMVEIADQEIGDLDNVSVVQGDMTKLHFENNSFDLITCYLDSICFLPSYTDVQHAFKEMHRLLQPGGILLFDVWTPYQLTEIFDGFSYFDYDESAALMWDSEVNKAALEVTHYLTVFEASEPGVNRYERKETELTERTYPSADYMKALVEAGFKTENIEILVDYGQKVYQENEANHERWFFRIRK